ncbi:hypothetical protein PMO31116_02512 [Pandoraea morbifera]|uniref:Uncharacterized protein n=1 Tax=Pandoraea morbifera TaxID=2508300 RepID=A0A5E4VC35_9BURK|nr:hypothetical protein [Pandoraea morbifera]VVE09124.1 hypothetical protein PMO31116_02512 [Pandoraea morbifera]
MWEMLDGDMDGFEVWMYLQCIQTNDDVELYSFIGLCRHRSAPFDNFIPLKPDAGVAFDARADAARACRQLARWVIDGKTSIGSGDPLSALPPCSAKAGAEARRSAVVVAPLH